VDDWSVIGGEPVAALQVGAPPSGLTAVEVGGVLVPRTIDELPLVAVLATQARGRTEVRDASELRLKESDRITAIVDGLSRMGAAIEERDDGFVVDGPSRLDGAEVDGCDDHRVVMALTVAALVATGDTSVSGADRIADSYPGFVEALNELGARVSVAG
jgi:3-phosphoshikimate 1-carboxyvinyltransferase